MSKILMALYWYRIMDQKSEASLARTAKSKARYFQ